MQSKRLMRMVMAGMAVLVGSTSVAAQECQRPPAKVATLVTTQSVDVDIILFCDKAKAPACAVTFYCSTASAAPGTATIDEDPVTWTLTVEPGQVFRYRTDIPYGHKSPRPPIPGSFIEALVNAGHTHLYATQGMARVCVVRSDDPVEVVARQHQWNSNPRVRKRVSYRISPPEPYPCLSSNAALSGLTVSGEGTLAPSFDSATTEYTFTTRATTVAFTPTVADSGATIRVNNTVVQSGIASGSFAVPWPRLPITVTAEDGTTTRTYYVSTTRFGS